GADVEFQYRYEQLADSFRITPTLSRGDVPVILNDSMKQTGVLVIDPFKTLPRRLVLHFTSLRVDSQSVLLKRYIPYLTVEVRENGLPVSDTVIWRAAGIREGTGTGNVFNRALPRYYLSGTLSNGEKWDFSLQMTYYNSSIAFDFGDRGVGNGRPSPSFLWGSGHRKGTVDFQVGDSVILEWHGGVRGEFPNAAKITLTGGGTSSSEVSQQLMDGIRIVPNPYIVRHAAQSGAPRIYFNYLPDRCTIRIYTIALDLVKTIEHSSGSREEWDLLTEGGQSVASQMLYAYIEAPNGMKTIKKFAVVVGK
ncbi:MAG: hypothetical protein HUU02_16995, partial [Bacteroidetes bacterium]|nr:hypothetical protein [Bacteroidota bacterium]